MNYDDLILDLEYQSIEIAHTNAKQISNVVIHISMMDIHTFLTLPCHIMSETYVYQVA